MRPYVFVRLQENTSRTTILLEGQLAEDFLKDPAGYVSSEFEDGELLNWWEVPTDLENATASGSVFNIFHAILALDALGETPVVSDLFATIFEAGYQLANREKNEKVPVNSSP